MTNALKLERPAKVRPAFKLVNTTSLDRDQWLEVRKGGIGSSDAAAAVGLNPYKSQLQLWMEKGTSKNRRFQPATVSSGLKSSGLPVL